MRCPDCGALNADTAGWCTQCYSDFRDHRGRAGDHTPAGGPTPTAETTPDRRAAPPPLPPSPHGAAARTHTTGTSATADATDSPLRAGGGRFRKVDEELEWRCAVCENWNPVGLTACSVCGSPFGHTIGEPGHARERRPIDAWAAAAASAVLPGTGHGLLGRRGAATVRAVTYLLWLLGGLLLVRSAAAAGQTMLPAVPLLAGALALLATSVHDAYVLADGRSDELLTARVFFWLVIAVSGGLMVSFIPAALRLGAGG